mgnify:FL=1
MGTFVFCWIIKHYDLFQAELFVGDNDGAIHIWDLKTDKTEQYVSVYSQRAWTGGILNTLKILFVHISFLFLMTNYQLDVS